MYSQLFLGAPGLFATPLGRLLVALLIVAVLVFVGRFVLALAWRLLVLAALVVAVLFALSLVGLV